MEKKGITPHIIGVYAGQGSRLNSQWVCQSGWITTKICIKCARGSE